MSEKDIIRISVYIPKPLKERVVAIASSQGRSMNDLILQWINDGMKICTVENAIEILQKRVDELEVELAKKK